MKVKEIAKTFTVYSTRRHFTIEINDNITSSGVYIFYLQKIPIYVGCSKNIMKRLKQHSSYRKMAFDRIEIINFPESEIMKKELEIIKEVEPIFNKVGNPNHNKKVIEFFLKYHDCVSGSYRLGDEIFTY